MAHQSDKIKILFLIDEMLIGGTEKQLSLVAEGLPCNRFTPVIGLLKDSGSQNRVETEIPIVKFSNCGPNFMINSVKLVWKIINYIKQEKVDILQTHFADSEIHGTAAVLLLRNKPVLISTRRDLYHWVNDAPTKFRIIRQMNRFADRVLVNSYGAYEEVQRREHVPAEKIKLIQNAVEIGRFESIETDEAKRHFGFGDIYPIIGIVANWHPVKGLVFFLNAAKELSLEIPSAQFVLVGFGPQERELKSLVQNLGIKERVKFLKNIVDVPKAIASFDVAVQASLSESFSNVLIEYMAAARAVVATKVGDAERIIEDGRDGLLVKPNNAQELANAIRYLCNNRDKSERMGRLAQEKVVANWSSEKIITVYQDYYEEAALVKRNRE